MCIEDLKKRHGGIRFHMLLSPHRLALIFSGPIPTTTWSRCSSRLHLSETLGHRDHVVVGMGPEKMRAKR